MLILLLIVAAQFDYKSSSGSSQYKFSVLAKIIKYMKVLWSSLFDILDTVYSLD